MCTHTRGREGRLGNDHMMMGRELKDTGSKTVAVE